MSLVRAYHAGYASEIQPFLDGAAGIAESQSTTNWLGRGVYFWESDHRRAEKWAIRNVREMILECHLETELLIDLLIDDQRSQAFWKLAEKQAPAVQSSSCQANDRSKEFFGLDGELINQLRPSLEKQYAGIRMAFCLDEPILPEGHLFPRQQIHLCMWNCQVIRKPRKYIGSSFRGL
jgi:hypothetical protein